MVSKHGMFICDVLEDLQDICAHMGLSDDDIIDLLGSGVSVPALLDYFQAAVCGLD